MTRNEDLKDNLKKDFSEAKDLQPMDKNNKNNTPEKGPLSFLSGALTSILFAFISFWVSKNVVVYFAIHTKEYNSSIAQSIASGLKTLVIGTCFLSTFTFAFIGLGLTIVFFRSLFNAKENQNG